MNTLKTVLFSLSILLLSSCGTKDKQPLNQRIKKTSVKSQATIPLDKGFTEYIAGYTSGIIPVNGVVEIRFTPEFAAKASRKNPSGIISFNPPVKGKIEWSDETTLIFRPSSLLSPGTFYSGEVNLGKLSDVEERLKVFPLRLQTLPKSFSIVAGLPESSPEGNFYTLKGEIITSDFIENKEVESFLTVRLGKKKLPVKWDHSQSLVNKFTINEIARTTETQELLISWDGSSSGVKQKGSETIIIPASGEFLVLGTRNEQGATQKIDIVFSDPVDASRELAGLIYVVPGVAPAISAKSNIVTIIPSTAWQNEVTLNVEQSVKNSKGKSLASSYTAKIDFTTVNPGIMLSGKGVILPVSGNLIFPFKAAGLRAVDLKIIKIFENNLPYFLQENDINTGYYVKRFGRPVYSGRIDLAPQTSPNTWNLYSIDLSDYIDVEPGILYKIQLGMRKSYTTLSCPLTEDEIRYEELLDESRDISRNAWDDIDNYYDDNEAMVYYSYSYRWEDRRDPCKGAYYSPDKNVTRNILASNLGLIAKRGEENNLRVMVNDILTALPVNEASIEVYDYQMQQTGSGITDKNGSVSISCSRIPFLVMAKKDKDRNYLKTNDGSSLSLSSFDVSGIKPGKGIKAFIYGERDVWRPGDSIFLSVFIKDMTNALPPDHPILFELINPLEQRVDNQVHKPQGNNLIVITSKTSPDAVTGTYRAQFNIGGATFTKRIRVETIKPNRLKINLDFPAEVLGGSAGTSTGSLNVKWLNGAVAANLKTNIEYILKHSGTKFEKYSMYDFDDPVKQFFSETVNIFEGSVDEAGNTSVKFDPGKGINAPGMLNALFTVRVREQGGDESIIQASYKYAPYSLFAGINLPGLQGKSRMLFTDTENEVRIITVDEKGKPVSSDIEVSVYKLSYRWWWESDDEDLASYISNQIYKPVIRRTITTAQGGEGAFKFKIDKKEWGRYLIRATTPEGHSAGKIILVDWPWEYGMKSSTDGATLLSVNTDKEKYNPGDEIRLSFPSPENAKAIITLENISGILDEIRVNTAKGNTEVKLKATSEMAPNVYAYVTVIQPHSQTVNDMPVRLYGVIPVMVEDPGTHITPVITMTDEIRSRKPFEIKVSETGRKPMTYTLAVVDEGLLDITGFKTPDPWSYFYAREALGVLTWDLYDYVLGAYGGALDRIFSTGGDEALIDRSANKAQRFPPVVKFLGPFTLAQGKTNTHTLTLPQYTGSVKVMVIAGNDRAFGSAEKTVTVRDPLMVLVTAPRVISPGEKAALPVTIFIQKDNIREISIRAEGNEFIRIEDGVRNIPVTGAGETDIEFNFTAGTGTGAGKIRVTASGGGESAVYDLEIGIRDPEPPETRAELKILNPGEKWEATFLPFGIEGSNSIRMELSALPSVNLEKRLDYLISYPHGCTEQLASAAFPQLWLGKLSGENSGQIINTEENIKTAVRTIIDRQMVNGGIAMWPGSYQADSWITSYTGHFMIEAEKLGYNITAGFRQKWIAYQQKYAREWRYDPGHKYTANDQAYRLFTLALAGEPDKGAMNRLRETEELPHLSRWLLAASYASSGRPEVADDLLDMRNITTENELSHYYYGDPLRDKAIILYTLAILNNREQALPVLKEICDKLNNDNWYSTQSLAWALSAYMKFVETLPGEMYSSINASLTFNGEKKTITAGSKEILIRDLPPVDGTNSFLLENNSGGIIYANLVRKGIPMSPGTEKSEKGLSMKVDYLTMDLKPADHTSVSQGTDFMMLVKVLNNTFNTVENIALTQMVPSGWEIRNTRLFEANRGIKESAYDHRDFRDDRVNTYFSLKRGETKTFVIFLNAAYKGEFSLPALWCEAMYTDNCYSRHPGALVKVTGE